jgi:hypothetical protein
MKLGGDQLHPLHFFFERSAGAFCLKHLGASEHCVHSMEGDLLSLMQNLAFAFLRPEYLLAFEFLSLKFADCLESFSTFVCPRRLRMK